MRISDWSSDGCSSDLIQHAVHDGHGAADDGTAGYHPHESPWTMLVPLGLLSLGAIFSGILFHHPFLYPEEGMAFWKSSIFFNEHLMHAAHPVPTLIKWMPFAAMAIGLAIAWNCYIRNTALPVRLVAHFGLLYKFLFNKWYFDELYDLLFVKPAFVIGRFFWKRGDEGPIDRFGPAGAEGPAQGGRREEGR